MRKKRKRNLETEKNGGSTHVLCGIKTEPEKSAKCKFCTIGLLVKPMSSLHNFSGDN